VGQADGTIDVVDLSNGRLRKLHGAQAGAIDSVGFSPDGRIVASGAEDGSVFAYDVSSGMLMDRFTGHESRVLGLAFSPDSKTLYSSSLDGAIFMWDLGKTRRFGVPFGTSTGPLFVVGPDEQEVAPPLAVSPDSRRFAMRVGRSQIAIIDVSDGRRVTSFHVDAGGNIAALAWSPQGRLAVSGDSGHVQLWDVSARPHLIRRLRGVGSINGQLESVTTLAFSPDGSLLAGGDVNHTPYSVPWRYGTAAIWDVSSGRLLWKVRSKRGWVTGVAFSPNGKTLAAGDESDVVQMYEARSGRAGTTIHAAGSRTAAYVSVAFSPAGKLATGDWAGVVQLWDPSSGREIGRPILAAPSPVSSIDFDPKGRTFATTGGSDGIARLWSTATLQQFGSNLPGAASFWGNAQFTHDGKHLVVVWVDGTGSVWPTSMKTLAQHACAVAGRNFTSTEWRQLVGGAYRTTCPGQPGVSGS
jgi:WD40 repeat protein